MKTSTSLLQGIPLYISKLLFKCTSIHSSLYPCLPLLWIISDCLLMMTIRRHKDTTSYTLQVIPQYMYIHSFFSTTLSSLIMNHLWLVIVFSWWISKTYSDVSLLNCKSYHCTEVCCCLNVHLFILLIILLWYNHYSTYYWQSKGLLGTILTTITTCQKQEWNHE